MNETFNLKVDDIAFCGLALSAAGLSCATAA
jgi:hypothetical protein